jgi:hypothetical protein
MRKEIPSYITPEGTRCPECKELCKVVPLKNDFNYAGTHCTHSLEGTYYPDSYGDPVSNCCLERMDDETI